METPTVPSPAPVTAPAAVPEFDEPDPRAVAAERMTFFADAVIAIAITLLALELPVPEGRTNAEILHSIGEDRSEYIGFLISFFVIGMHWNGHHRAFRYVTTLGGTLPMLTILWLLMQVITPFATKVLNGEGAFQFRFILYASVQALAGILFLLMVRQVQVHKLYRPDTPPTMFRKAYVWTGGLAAGFLVSIPMSFWSESSYYCWIVAPILTAIGYRIVERRSKART